MTQIIRKDACGQEIKVGDMVAYVAPYSSHLEEGFIIKLTSKGFSISKKQGGNFKVNRVAEQVIKLPKELRMERLLGI